MPYENKLQDLSLDDVYQDSQTGELQAKTERVLGFGLNPYYEFPGPRFKVAEVSNANATLADVTRFLVDNAMNSFEPGEFAEYLGKDVPLSCARKVGLIAVTDTGRYYLTVRGEHHDPSRTVLSPAAITRGTFAVGLAAGLFVELKTGSVGDVAAALGVIAIPLHAAGTRVDAILKHYAYMDLDYQHR